uniref:GPI ethanolamine phosphate transferase 3 n=1 Tax=Meloidogyne hapla TaxID=6305 RepID=A0A1I8BW74_MELHA
MLRFIALSVIYAISLIIFQKGLLVKRHVLPLKSSCSDIITSENCWIKPKYNKSIILIIDALRFDFIFPYENCMGTQRRDGDEKYYHGQMSKVAKLLREQPGNAILFPYIAEAPTTTFQRIKALVTGSVPAFIEAGDNFDGTKISEDNILDQLLASGKNATLLGDETWLQLLPERFHRHFEEPSFDIMDLDTVDNAVIANIFNEIDRSDWSLIIAHCLGVDHAGHRYGPAHAEMSRKLLQMDKLIWDLTQKLPQDAILFVLGDHGMTSTGDHGGDSLNELNTALFVYTHPKGNDSEKSFSAEFDCSGNYWCGVEPVSQVDLVPTLSLLLDVPIPFPNIGQIIKHLFGGDSYQEMKLNAFQMFRYAQEYSKHQIELKEPLSKISRHYENAVNSNDLSLTMKNLSDEIRSTLDQFHFGLSLVGIFSLIDSLAFNCFLICEAKNTTPFCLWIFRSAMILLQVNCNPYIFTTEQILPWSVLGSLISTVFLLEDKWKASKITKLFVWPLFVLLFFHWFLELTARIVKEKPPTPHSAYSINLFENLSQSLAKSIFTVAIAHFFAIKFFKDENLNKINWLKSTYQMLSLPLIMLVGADYGWRMAFCLILFPVADFFFKNENKNWCWLMSLLAAYCFYATGNQRTLSSIPWRAAFVGLPGNFAHKWVSASFILTAMFFGQLLASLMAHMKEETAPFYLILFLAIKVFGSVSASLLHHKHLMFYKVFAPKFVFDAVELLTCCAFNFIIYLLTMSFN